MRTLNPSLALTSLVGFLTAASCTLITDVDRTKIPTDAGAEAGAPGSGGTTESGGTGGTAQTGGTGGTDTGGTAGTGGEAGQNPTGGTGGESGAGTGATGGTSGTAGGGPVTPVCTPATGTITLAPMTFFSDKDSFSIGDGINDAVVFELDLNGNGVTSGHVAIPFDGTENQFGLAALITTAINDQRTAGALLVKATFAEAPVNNGGGEGGAAGAAGSAAGGADNGGAATSPTSPDPATDTAHIALKNDLAGALGNVKINRSKSSAIGQGVGNGNFKTTGMSGGDAVACASAASCSTDDECASNQCGSDSKCAQ